MELVLDKPLICMSILITTVPKPPRSQHVLDKQKIQCDLTAKYWVYTLSEVAW